MSQIMIEILAEATDLGLEHLLEITSRVLVVAVKGDVDDWAAYVGPASWTPREVHGHGSKLPQEDAARLFPILKADRYRR